ncbi:piggyBac transposable element-derived protein 4-like [Dreissena polymorpha]|uniref:piggyBac transposable element-derived protein 4-like n=1 Tax=Dreissena polymorpha TaxID=45954 RepID=UPI00226546C0|nr:piggyBac transposable element-derived protein 4-like [Dreissena polymorpha]
MAMYWSTDVLYGNFSVRRIMTRDRFMKVLQYLHCNDRTKMKPKGHKDHDKLYLIRPFLDAVRKLCLTLYNPHRNVSIDEAMVKFRGRLGFRQYMPLKPARYGVKVWVRADPVNGYVNDFQVYTGKDANTAEVGLATRVVLDLSRVIKGMFYIVNVDNFFTSPVLFEELLKQETYARGTVRTNRKGYPSSLLGKKKVQEQGDYVFATKGEQLACVWMDKKPIYTLSTAENPKDIGATVLRKKRNGEVHQVPAPRIIPEYNNNMNGVDHADQLRTEYPTFRTSRKWWTYMFFFILDTAITNGYVVMRESPFHQQRSRTGKAKDRTVLDFRMNLSKQLIGDYCENGAAKMATVKAGHFPGHSEKRGRCRQCTKQKRRHECNVICLECNVHICVPCFKDWHVELAKSS